MIAQVQVLNSEREVEWTGDLDELLQANGELTASDARWLETLEVGEEHQVGSGEPFSVRRIA